MRAGLLRRVLRDAGELSPGLDQRVRGVVLALLVVALIVVAVPFIWMLAMMFAMGGVMPFGPLGGMFAPMLVLWLLVLLALLAVLAWAVRASTRA